MGPPPTKKKRHGCRRFRIGGGEGNKACIYTAVFGRHNNYYSGHHCPELRRTGCMSKIFFSIFCGSTPPIPTWIHIEILGDSPVLVKKKKEINI